jgi:glycosyltransferase involved in cell wall biosynthesis
MNITLLLLNPFTNDARVHKEAKTLASNGHKVTVVALWQKGLKQHEEQDGYNIIRLHLRARAWRGALVAPLVKYMEFGFKVWRLAGSHPAHVYHANDALTLPAGWLASRRNHSKLVYDAHELETGREVSSSRLAAVYKRTWALPEKIYIKKADAVITVNESIANELVRLYHVPRPTVVMNCPEYHTVLRTNRLREELNIPAEQKIVLYQGRIAVGRGIECLIQSVRSMPEISVVILGEGPSLDEYRKMALSGQWERVYLPGKVPLADLLSYSASADLGVILTEDNCMNNHLSLPNKLFEYMHAGLPVIASNLPEIARVLIGHHIGEVVNPDDPQDIGRAISRLLTDPVRYSQYRSNAQKAAASFTWEQESKNLLAIYQSIEQNSLGPE